MPDLNTYKSTLTPEEVDEALKNIGKVLESVQEAERWANVAKANAEHPVGYIFEWAPVHGQSTDLSTAQKVADYFGYGTWAEIGPGQVLAAANGSHAAGTSVGSETHTMTLPELVAHEHVMNGWSYGIPNPSGGESQFAPTEPYTSINNFTGTTKPSGEGQPFSIMQPTLYVYRWQRIA